VISHEHKFVLVLLPKTGTTSLASVISNNPGLYNDVKLGSGVGRHYDMLGESELNYFKIATCRNPFPRVVSLWKYWNRRLSKKDVPTTGFSYFVKNYTKMQKKILRCSWVGTKDKIHFCTCVVGVSLSTHNRLSHTDIDFWIRTENLQKDFNTICDKIGIPRQQLPRKNETKHKHYTEYYDEETKQIVAERYAKDIEYFNYEF